MTVLHKSLQKLKIGVLLARDIVKRITASKIKIVCLNVTETRV